MRGFLRLILAVAFLSSSATCIFSMNNSTDWLIYLENEEVTIEYKKTDCNFSEQFDQEYIIFKITNHLDKSIIINWRQELWYDNDCINCESISEEYIKKISLESKQTMTGNCSRNDALRIFSKFIEELKDMPGVDRITELTKFDLKNITIQYE
tara:strand:+ start:1126 stop:1584 length:459 start_codon:yes stop_codon:yes gene_type:complete